MLKNLTEYHRPLTIPEACRLLGAANGKFAPLAGGTHLGVVRDNNLEGLVDLNHLGLSYINTTPTTFAIGALTPIQDILTDTTMHGPTADLLRATAARIGSTLLRHAITLGGNVVSVFPWSDMPPALLVLDADVVCHRGLPKRTVPITSLYATSPRAFLEKQEIVTDIVVPIFDANTGTAFTKFAKTANDYALLSVAIRLTMKDGDIAEARIAVSGMVKKPVRRLEVETFLVGKKPAADLFAQAARRACDNLDLTKDFRASDEYRLEVLEVFVRRALEEAAGKAKGGK